MAITDKSESTSITYITTITAIIITITIITIIITTVIILIITITTITIIIPRHLRDSTGCRPSKEQRGPSKKLVVHQPTIVYNISTILQQSFTYT